MEDDEEHLGYLRFDDVTNVCTTTDGVKKLSKLYHRVETHAPWLFQGKSSAGNARQGLKFRWILLAICYLFSFDIEDQDALQKVMLKFICYLGSYYMYLLCSAYNNGKVGRIFLPLPPPFTLCLTIFKHSFCMNYVVTHLQH